MLLETSGAGSSAPNKTKSCNAQMIAKITIHLVLGLLMILGTEKFYQISAI
jgi:hypothetical protein